MNKDQSMEDKLTRLALTITHLGGKVGLFYEDGTMDKRTHDTLQKIVRGANQELNDIADHLNVRLIGGEREEE